MPRNTGAAKLAPDPVRKELSDEEKAALEAQRKELLAAPPIDLGDFRGEIVGQANLYADGGDMQDVTYTLEVDGMRSGVLLAAKDFHNPPYAFSFGVRRTDDGGPFCAALWPAAEGEPRLLPLSAFNAGQAGTLFFGGRYHKFEMQEKADDKGRLNRLDLGDMKPNQWYHVSLEIGQIISVVIRHDSEDGEILYEGEFDRAPRGSLYFVLGYPWSDGGETTASFEFRSVRL